MTDRIKVLTNGNIDDSCDDEDFARDVMEGLSGSSKAVPCKYFYDGEGGRLFRRITELPEYYLTDCEFEILHRSKEDIMNAIGEKSFNLIELGAGDGKKTKVLINHFLRSGLDIRYIPIDICHSEITNLIEKFDNHDIDVPIDGLVAEYFDGLKWMASTDSHLNLALFLGSNIGNFDNSESVKFLEELWNALNDGDHVLVGFDMKKDADVLNKAYNDSENVTAEFNLNLLRRINRELKGEFDLGQFKYRGGYNESSGAVESYIVSMRDQSVFIGDLNKTFMFEKGESIHTENSFKFTEAEIAELAESTGFTVVQNYKDLKNYFMDSLWKVRKS